MEGIGIFYGHFLFYGNLIYLFCGNLVYSTKKSGNPARRPNSVENLTSEDSDALRGGGLVNAADRPLLPECPAARQPFTVSLLIF
jgi:hypothetical protein